MPARCLDFLRYAWERYVLAAGDKVTYLRMKGVRIGCNCSLAPDVENFGSEPWLVQIGDRVTLTTGVVLLTHDGSSRLFRDRLPGMNRRYGNLFGRVRILDNSFVGVNSIILPGVTIGPDSIVGAGSVVTRDVLPGTVVAGSPARVICTLDEYIAKCQRRMLPLGAQDRESLRHELLGLLGSATPEDTARPQMERKRCDG